ncbi:MAG TPA: DUF2116 family Zn-ribbon domain-containing protein [Thermoplasmata archaeon]|nr:DUF2116 family Zn-ribbon domain-containing protein [Thermoplasmata archaeon]
MPDPADHRHCRVCGKVCDPDSETCSRRCREDLARRQQSKRGYTYLMYALIAIVAAVLILSQIGR